MFRVFELTVDDEGFEDIELVAKFVLHCDAVRFGKIRK